MCAKEVVFLVYVNQKLVKDFAIKEKRTVKLFRFGCIIMGWGDYHLSRALMLTQASGSCLVDRGGPFIVPSLSHFTDLV